jgi:cystathionine beta-lyase
MDAVAQFDPSIDRLRSRHGVKWSRDPEALPLWVADMDFDPPPAVTETLRGYLDRGDLGYSRVGAELAPAFVSWQEQRHGWTPDVDRVATFTSALHALEIVLWHLTEPGDGVVVFTPVYFPFLSAIEASGRRRVEVPLDPHGWRIDPERLEAAIDDGTEVVLFCHPHNPTGRVYDEHELAAVADVAERHDLLVISDEIWGDLTYEGSTFTPLAVADERFGGRLITIGSASKAFNLAGLRCAVAHVDHRPTNDVLASMPAHLCGAPSTLGVAATLAAWEHSADWLDAACVELDARRTQLVTAVAGLPGVAIDPPEATYLAWLDFRGAALGDDPAAPLRDAGLALSAGPQFGGPSNGFARLNFATTSSILADAVECIASALRSPT